MDKLEIRVALPENALGNDRLNTLRISVSHDEGGFSWATGEPHKRGIVCKVTPIEVRGAIIGQIYDGTTRHQGFYVFLEACGRKSPKKMEKCFEAIKPHAQEIADMFVQGNYVQIARNITEWV